MVAEWAKASIKCKQDAPETPVWIPTQDYDEYDALVVREALNTKVIYHLPEKAMIIKTICVKYNSKLI